jgi:hypothetical protein
VIRRGHHDGIDIGLVQKLVIIEKAFGIELVGRFAFAFFVHVADGDDLATFAVLVAVGL